MVKEQLQDKIDLVEHLESQQSGITDQSLIQMTEMQALNDQLKSKIADLETQTRDRTQELEETVQQVLDKDQQFMQFRMEIEMKQTSSLSLDQERSFEQKQTKRDCEKAQFAEKKALEEIQWLKEQLAEQKAKTKAFNEENDKLQDELCEIKSSNAQTPDGGPVGDEALRLQEFERGKMQEAIDELGERCRTLREDKKKLDAENNFFHMSTSIFIKLKPIMETEKQLCYQLAEVNLSCDDEDYEMKKEKIESSISKCRDTIDVIEAKLQKVLARAQKCSSKKRALTSRKPRAPKQDGAAQMNASTISVSLLDLTNMTNILDSSDL